MKIRFLCVRYTCGHGTNAIKQMVEENLNDLKDIPERHCPECGRTMDACIDVMSRIGTT